MSATLCNIRYFYIYLLKGGWWMMTCSVLNSLSLVLWHLRHQNLHPGSAFALWPLTSLRPSQWQPLSLSRSLALCLMQIISCPVTMGGFVYSPRAFVSHPAVLFCSPGCFLKFPSPLKMVLWWKGEVASRAGCAATAALCPMPPRIGSRPPDQENHKRGL